MTKKSILIVSGSNTGQLAGVLDESKFITAQANSDEAAIELANQRDFDAVLIDVTSELEARTKLNAILPVLQPEIVIVSYNSTNTKDIQLRLLAALKQKRNERMKGFRIMDAQQGPLADLPLFSAN